MKWKCTFGCRGAKVWFWLLGVEVVEDDVKRSVQGGDYLIHEVEELDAPALLGMGGGHLAGRYLEGGKQGGCAVAPVVVAVAGQSPAIRQLQVACARSSAWIEGFSSTQITIAFSGGAM